MDYKREGKRLKKKAKSKGNFVSVNIPNSYALMETLAHFFYQKHHEWAAICFLDSTYSCKKIWFNKGPDHTTVSLGLTPEQIVNKASNIKAQNIIIAHNHPVSSKDMPNYTSKSASIRAQKQLKRQQFGFSPQDKLSGAHYDAELTTKELNVAEAVFVAGSYQIEGEAKIVDTYKRNRKREESIFNFNSNNRDTDNNRYNEEVVNDINKFVKNVLIVFWIIFILGVIAQLS